MIFNVVCILGFIVVVIFVLFDVVVVKFVVVIWVSCDCMFLLLIVRKLFVFCVRLFRVIKDGFL